MSKEDNDDREWMTHPSYWPNWPYQTIKNPREKDPDISGMPRLGVLVEFSGPTTDETKADIRFVPGCIYTVDSDAIAKAEKADVDKLLSAGWVID